MDTLRLLDILGFAVGIVYLILEYKASIWLWLASIIMPAVDMVLYYKAGLYADFGMAVYYCLAAVYGYLSWRFFRPGKGDGTQKERPVTRYRREHIIPSAAAALLLWAAIWFILVRFTDSTVPVADAFTTALSIVALWALARKYAEQWLIWLAVDLVCCILYVYKGIPFKAAIYGIYTVVAVLGYRKWLGLAATADAQAAGGQEPPLQD